MNKFILRCIFVSSFFLLPTSHLSAEEISLENFDNPSKFKQNKAPQSLMKVTSEPGRTGNALRIDFDLTKDHFVEIGAPVSIDLKKVRELTWYMKGDFDGSILELKFIDEDGSTFGKKMPLQGVSKTDWRQFKLPIKEIHYLWGGDQNMGRIKEFGIAVSRGLARKGYVELDTLNYSMGKSPIDFDINLNQVGYHPTDKKFFIVRVNGIDNDKNLSGDFSIIETVDGTSAYTGKLEKTNFSEWTGAFLKGKFSDIDVPGKYRIRVKLKMKDSMLEKESYSFNINNSILSAMTLVHELNYLNYERCGIRCHKQDPVMGGWHDTLFDISKRMWSIPSLVYGIARYVGDGTIHVKKTPEGGLGDMDELIWGLRFITDMADSDGVVPWGGIEADFKKFMTYDQFIARIGPLKPEDDLLPRIRYPEKNFFATAFNLVAIVNSIPLIKQKDPGLASKAEGVAEKAWQWLDKQPLGEAREYGAYLWAATELYKYNSNKKYLYRLGEVAPKLLSLQALNFKQFENFACGDFYTSRVTKDFMFQYKYVSFNIAINLALINLSELLTPSDPLWFDIYYANYVFGENYLKGMSSKTPYRQVAHGLEPDSPKSAIADIEWQPMAQAGVNSSIETSKEGKNSILTMNFEFGGTGEWSQLFKPVSMDLSKLETLSFEYKYSGEENNLEFKLTDDRNTNFGSKLKLERTSGWKTEEIGAKDLKYFWGDNTVLNVKNIKQVWFALAKISGGKGTLSLRNLQFTDEDGLKTKIPMGTEASETKFVQRYFAGAQAEKAAASFHGLNCDHLGLAYVALRWGYIADDLSLEEFADNQASWVLGLNPLNYCMLLGAGTENPSIMAEYYGKPRINGIIPNGIVGSGPKDEPEWRGDGPSSGEDWLPHNAAYFAALSLLDTPSKVFGKILLNGNPVQNATVEIRENGKPVTRGLTNSAGLFGPITVTPQKQYKLIAYIGNNSAIRDIALLSGERKKVVIDFAGEFQIDIKTEGKIEAGKKATLAITISKNAIGKSYKLLLKGAKSNVPEDGVVASDKFNVPVVPDGDKPVMAVFLIKGYPPVYKTLYIRNF